MLNATNCEMTTGKIRYLYRIRMFHKMKNAKVFTSRNKFQLK